MPRRNNLEPRPPFSSARTNRPITEQQLHRQFPDLKRDPAFTTYLLGALIPLAETMERRQLHSVKRCGKQWIYLIRLEETLQHGTGVVKSHIIGVYTRRKDESEWHGGIRCVYKRAISRKIDVHDVASANDVIIIRSGSKNVSIQVTTRKGRHTWKESLCWQPLAQEVSNGIVHAGHLVDAPVGTYLQNGNTKTSLAKMKIAPEGSRVSVRVKVLTPNFPLRKLK